MNVGVTGASGFVGSALVRRFSANGWVVTPLGRNEERHYDLANAVDPTAFAGLDVLVHTAYAPGEDNVAAAARLLRAAREARLEKILFMSSLAADAQSSSQYGRDKYAIEQMLNAKRDIAVRPGLVAGNGGLYGAMRETIRKFGFAPVFGDGRQPVYLVGVDELADAAVTLVERDATGMFFCSGQSPIAFCDLCASIANAMHRRVRFIRLPLQAVLSVLGACEAVGLRLPISAESVRGIANLRTVTIPAHEGLRFTAPGETIRRVEAGRP